MGDVLSGYAAIVALIVLGVLLARRGVVTPEAEAVMARLAITVASPALLVTVLQDSDVASLWSGSLVAVVVAVAVTATIAVAAAAWRGQGLGATVVTAMCAAYGNAGNLGLPIAAYVLGDAALAAPLLLLQMLVLLPVITTLLDLDGEEGALSARGLVLRPLTNPITVASGIGLGLSVVQVRLPPPVADPVALLGGMAVPLMLLAYGAALGTGPLPGRGVRPAALGGVLALKLVLQPVVAYGAARFLLGLDATAVLAVTVMASLPTAQNAYVLAARYDRGGLLARDAIFVGTLLSLPATVVVTVLLG
ncbi:MAG: AEC family transporter [Nocardioides alkalitolerans]